MADLHTLAQRIREQAAVSARPGQMSALEAIADELEALQDFVADEIEHLKHTRKITGRDREGNPEFQYSHDHARWEAFTEVRRHLDGEVS